MPLYDLDKYRAAKRRKERKPQAIVKKAARNVLSIIFPPAEITLTINGRRLRSWLPMLLSLLKYKIRVLALIFIPILINVAVFFSLKIFIITLACTIFSALGTYFLIASYVLIKARHFNKTEEDQTIVTLK